jgi:cysteine desulfuration protein SufE
MQDFQEIVDTFDLLENWEARYEYLVELGENLPTFPEQYRDDVHKVKGCMSTVHIVAEWTPDHGNRVGYRADCDTAIIKGVLALLVEVLSGRTPEEIEEADLDSLFQQLGLFEHLSPTRHFGIYAIVEMMKGQARELAASGPPSLQ